MTIAQQIVKVRNVLSGVRDSLYLTIGAAAQLPTSYFFAMPHLAPLLMQSVFANYTSFSLRTWKGVLTHVLKPLMYQCPPELIESVLGPLLMPLLGHLVSHLEREWARLDAAGMTASTLQESRKQFDTYEEDFALNEKPSTEDITEQIIEQVMIVDATRSLADLLHNLLLEPHTPKEKAAAATAHAAYHSTTTSGSNSNNTKVAPVEVDPFYKAFGPLRGAQLKVMLMTPVTAQAIFLSLSACMAFKDSSTCSRASVDLYKFLSVISEWEKGRPTQRNAAFSDQIAQFVGANVLTQALLALMEGYFSDCHSSIMVLITEILLQWRTKSASVGETLAQRLGMSGSDLQMLNDALVSVQGDVKKERKIVSDVIGKAKGVRLFFFFLHFKKDAVD